MFKHLGPVLWSSRLGCHLSHMPVTATPLPAQFPTNTPGEDDSPSTWSLVTLLETSIESQVPGVSLDGSTIQTFKE